jgi:hypothetical protein
MMTQTRVGFGICCRVLQVVSFNWGRICPERLSKYGRDTVVEMSPAQVDTNVGTLQWPVSSGWCDARSPQRMLTRRSGGSEECLYTAYSVRVHSLALLAQGTCAAVVSALGAGKTLGVHRAYRIEFSNASTKSRRLRAMNAIPQHQIRSVFI